MNRIALLAMAVAAIPFSIPERAIKQLPPVTQTMPGIWTGPARNEADLQRMFPIAEQFPPGAIHPNGGLTTEYIESLPEDDFIRGWFETLR